MSNFSLFVLNPCRCVCLFILQVYLQDFRLEISAVQLPRKVKLLLPRGQKELAEGPLECRRGSSESVLVGGDLGVNPQLTGGIIYTVLPGRALGLPRRGSKVRPESATGEPEVWNTHCCHWYLTQD